MIEHFFRRSLDNEVPPLPGFFQQKHLLSMLSELDIGRLNRKQDSLEVASWDAQEITVVLLHLYWGTPGGGRRGRGGGGSRYCRLLIFPLDEGITTEIWLTWRLHWPRLVCQTPVLHAVSRQHPYHGWARWQSHAEWHTKSHLCLLLEILQERRRVGGGGEITQLQRIWYSQIYNSKYACVCVGRGISWP